MSLTADEVKRYREAVAQWHPGIVRTPALVEAVFGKQAAASIGPTFIGYSDAKHFRPISSGEARPLTANDEQAVELLRSACAAEEWEHGGSQFRPDAMIGMFKGEDLAALASYELWGERIAHICVVTHPAFRGLGYATTVVSALTAIALRRTLVPPYRTLEANASSLAVARRLGFLPYATSLAVRFVLPSTEGN